MNPIQIALDNAPGTRKRLIFATICAAIATLSGILLLALAGWFLTAAMLAGAAGPIAVQAFNYLIPSAAIRLLAIARTASRYGERLWSHNAALGAMGGLRAMLFAKLAVQDSRTAIDLSSGDAAARLTGDVDALEELIVRRPSRIAGLLAALAGGALAATAGWRCGLLLVALLALLPLLLRWIAPRITEEPAREAAEALGLLRARHVDYAAARPEIVAYGLGPQVMEDLQPLIARLDRARARLFIGEGIQAAVLATYVAFATMMVLLSAVGPAPIIALALLSCAGAVEAMAGLSRSAFRQASVTASLHRLTGIATLATPTMAASAPHMSASLRLGSMQLAPGDRVAIIGRSGSGKTLLAEGLAGLRAVIADAAVDGRPLATVPAALLQRQFALSPQDAPLLAGSIADNLRLARPGIDHAMMMDALAVSCLEDRIATLPGGLDFQLGEAGSNLSGGERKRLSLARALLAGRPWLLLDEPTEGLDAATEARMIERLRHWLDRTGTGLILISHRPAPLQLARHRIDVARIGAIPALPRGG
ncbi:ATP-binding cassette domain-containing protein [Sphingobium sp. AP49]|uniref:amino acid ABC transporter ATP-binding/permease protein n=1 Tax=Sphingobium sp. AP49 TaxID=1144307 RepID=UPI00026ECF21|nr:ATP-binding cassette domain-containing protein [Sphingobium sp. AP49]WHO37938.1 ATP-binding cassette domain-containing protein [Sphingobium sp. AP49]